MMLSRVSAMLKRWQLGRRAVIAFPLLWLTLFFFTALCAGTQNQPLRGGDCDSALWPAA